MPFITANGVRLYYEWHGDDHAPVLVLNNGILMNAAASWKPQTAAFAASFRVLQYDCRGQGQSDHTPTPYSMALHAADLDALLTALDVGDAHILGISYGGEVAQAFALTYPARTRSLVLAATVSEVRPALRLVVDGWRRAALPGDSDLFFSVTVPWSFSSTFIARYPALVANARERYAALDLPAIARLSDAFFGVDFTARLETLTVPSCVIVGDADCLKGPEYAQTIHEHLRGSELHVLPGVGHAATWEAPEAFNRLVLQFLARVSAPPTGTETTSAL
jgi:3-oxoadipate enol-lactonase